MKQKESSKNLSNISLLSLLSLPEEMVVYILSFLYFYELLEVRSVCKLFHRICIDPQVQRTTPFLRINYKKKSEEKRIRLSSVQEEEELKVLRLLPPTASLKAKKELERRKKHRENTCFEIKCLARLAKDRFLVGTVDGNIRICNSKTGKCEQTVNAAYQMQRYPSFIFAISENMFISGSGHDKQMTIWSNKDDQGFKRIKTIFTNDHIPKNGILLSEHEIICGLNNELSSLEGTLGVWDINTQTNYPLTGHTRPVTCLAKLFNVVISGSMDNTVRIWDWKQKRCLRILTGHQNYVLGVAVRKDGQVVSCGDDTVLNIWNINTDECKTIKTNHSEKIYAVAYLPSGHIISMCKNNKLGIWNSETGECLNILKSMEELRCMLVLSGGQIVTGTNTGIINIQSFANQIPLSTLFPLFNKKNSISQERQKIKINFSDWDVAKSFIQKFDLDEESAIDTVFDEKDEECKFIVTLTKEHYDSLVSGRDQSMLMQFA